MPSSPLRHRISGYRAAVAVAFLVVAVVLLRVFDGPAPPLLLVAFGITTLFLLVSAFDAVRAHSLYDLASAVFSALVCGLAAAITDFDNAFLLAAAALTLVGVAVECYNYRYGTTYLRLDFAGTNGS